MMICAFFGHKDTSDNIKPILEKEICNIIAENKEVTFYVGTHGHFDGMVQSVLEQLSKEYPNIKYYIVLAYLSNSENDRKHYENLPTIFPDGIEKSLPKYAISYRNKWIARKADIIICYIKHNYGGAAQFVKYAKNQGKEIINLAEK